MTKSARTNAFIPQIFVWGIVYAPQIKFPGIILALDIYPSQCCTLLGGCKKRGVLIGGKSRGNFPSNNNHGGEERVESGSWS